MQMKQALFTLSNGHNNVISLPLSVPKNAEWENVSVLPIAR